MWTEAVNAFVGSLMDNPASGRVAGAQSLRRALHLLRLVGARHEEGVSVAELAQLAQLERPTVHRLVTCLAQEHFLDRDAQSRRYRLGFEATNLGLVSLERVPVLERYRPMLQRVARISGDTLFLLVRQGDHAICLYREAGPYPVKVFTIDVGERRLLGIGAGGLALLATLPDASISAAFSRHAARYRQVGLDQGRIERMIALTRRNGYSTTIGTITPGIAGVGVAFEAAPGSWAAISVGAIHSRLGPARREELVALLKSELRPVGGGSGRSLQPPRSRR